MTDKKPPYWLRVTVMFIFFVPLATILFCLNGIGAFANFIWIALSAGWDLGEKAGGKLFGEIWERWKP